MNAANKRGSTCYANAAPSMSAEGNGPFWFAYSTPAPRPPTTLPPLLNCRRILTPRRPRQHRDRGVLVFQFGVRVDLHRRVDLAVPSLRLDQPPKTVGAPNGNSRHQGRHQDAPAFCPLVAVGTVFNLTLPRRRTPSSFLPDVGGKYKEQIPKQQGYDDRKKRG